MNYLHNFIKVLVFVVFIVYWGATLIFSFPETSIVIAENYKGYKIFQKIFYQKWNFFAPPPTHNLRLHYIFKSNKRLYDIEIFENLNKKVQEKYLFNDTYANTSWLLFSNVDNLVQSIGRIHNSFVDLGVYKDKNTNSIDSVLLKDEYDHIRNVLQSTGSMQIVLHYANGIAKEMKLSENYDVQIIISAIDILKYGERNKSTIKKQEKILFASSFYSNKLKKWEELPNNK